MFSVEVEVLVECSDSEFKTMVLEDQWLNFRRKVWSLACVERLLHQIDTPVPAADHKLGSS